MKISTILISEMTLFLLNLTENFKKLTFPVRITLLINAEFNLFLYNTENVSSNCHILGPIPSDGVSVEQ